MERNFKFSTMIGQKYETHTDDYFVDEFNAKNGGQRTGTLLLYLSDVEEWGETVFPCADVNISSVPWWNELSECAKQSLSLKPKRAMHCFSGAQDLMRHQMLQVCVCLDCNCKATDALFAAISVFGCVVVTANLFLNMIIGFCRIGRPVPCGSVAVHGESF
ncbi:hypothetical protein POTOM_009306 [Populus tomentosa]|uniref:Prolyl 4-hydroxylase alpha subunit Fe(2+) 2OG dioxygenase domain-containing protein n=1 Tax=Populus tomentosa TaxID=118781 RepID=A0A8X8A632_POPTO|nr:hypothetical protein POTOM_009306 [Populus tomentosa]